MHGDQDRTGFTLTGEVNITATDVAQGLGQLSLFRRRWSYLLLAALFVGLLAVSGQVSLPALTPFLIFTALFQAYLFLGPLIMGKRTIAAMPDRTIRYRADDREITIATTGSTVTRSWDRLTLFREVDKAFLIWVGPYAVQVIPKRAFNAEGIDWLRARLAHTVKAEGTSSAKRWSRLIGLWLILVLAFLLLWQLLNSAPRRS